MNRRNDYLMRKDERDYRNPYGSQGGYVDSRYQEDMRGRDYRNDYYSGGNQYDSRGYDRYNNRQSNNDHRDYRGYEDYGSMRQMGRDYSMKEEEYKKDLKHWIKKMEAKTPFSYSKEQIIQRAREMKIKFDEFTEDEFYAVYLAMVTDYKKISNDFNVYISLAKDFLMDDDIAVSPSEKVCIYMYEIVMGGK